MFNAESPKNYEQKCLCTLVLDTSASMRGRPLEELLSGLAAFRAEIEADWVAANRLELSIYAFDSVCRLVQSPSLVGDMDLPLLEAGGTTRLVEAIREAMAGIEARKAWYRATGQPYYRPMMVLITDGEPDEGQDVEALATELRAAVGERKFSFFALGVKGYRHDVLARICPEDSPPLPLEAYRFSAFFKWLSNSISVMTKSEQGGDLVLPPVSDWSSLKF